MTHRFDIRLQQTETIDKLEGARRQLVVAIQLFFERRDALAIHSLVSASHQVLADLGGNQGYKGVFRNKAIIKDEKWKEWRNTFAQAEQFLKHADQDPTGTLEFRSFLAELFLMDALEIYALLQKKLFWEGFVFRNWFWIAYPNLVPDNIPKQLGEMLAKMPFGADDCDDWRSLLNQRKIALQHSPDMDTYIE